MSKAYPIATVAVLSCTLAACASSGGGLGGGAPVDQGPETVVRGESPEALYARIARQVKTCWLSPADPVLKDHLFHAEVPAGGNKGAVNIVINERTRKNERGLKAFGIDFEPLSNGTKIVARNHRLDYALGQKLTADVGFWAQGGETCNPPAAATDSKDNPISGPRISR